MKTKKRERLRITEEEMRVCLSHIRSNIGEITRQPQAQTSHKANSSAEFGVTKENAE